MKLSGYAPRSSADGSIHFPILECWNPVTKCVSIAADVNGKRVLCRVPETVLKKRFGAIQDGGPTAQVVANRRVIEAAATELIRRKAFTPDGNVDIKLEDLREVKLAATA